MWHGFYFPTEKYGMWAMSCKNWSYDICRHTKRRHGLLQPSQVLFCMTPTIELYFVVYSVGCVIHNKWGLARLMPSKPSFCRTATRIPRPVLPWLDSCYNSLLILLMNFSSHFQGLWYRRNPWTLGNKELSMMCPFLLVCNMCIL